MYERIMHTDGTDTQYLFDFSTQKQAWIWTPDWSKSWAFNDAEDAIDYIDEWGDAERLILGGFKVSLTDTPIGGTITSVRKPTVKDAEVKKIAKRMVRPNRELPAPAKKVPVAKKKPMRKPMAKGSGTTTRYTQIVGTTAVGGRTCQVASDDAGHLYPLTPCCNASGKGSMNSSTGVVCRSCYGEVSPMFGGYVNSADVVPVRQTDDAQTSDDFAAFDNQVCIVEIVTDDETDVLVGVVTVDDDTVTVTCSDVPDDAYTFEAVDVDNIALVA